MNSKRLEQLKQDSKYYATILRVVFAFTLLFMTVESVIDLPRTAHTVATKFTPVLATNLVLVPAHVLSILIILGISSSDLQGIYDMIKLQTWKETTEEKERNRTKQDNNEED